MAEKNLWEAGWALSPIAFGELGQRQLDWFEGRNGKWVKEARGLGAYEPIGEVEWPLRDGGLYLSIGGKERGLFRKGRMWEDLGKIGGRKRVVVDCDFEFLRSPAEIPECSFGMARACHPRARVDLGETWMMERNSGLVVIGDWGRFWSNYEGAMRFMRDYGHYRGHFLLEQKTMSVAHEWANGEELDPLWNQRPDFWKGEGEPWAWHYVGSAKTGMGFPRLVQ